MIRFAPAIVALMAVGFGYFSQWCSALGQACFRTAIDQAIPEITYPLFFFFSFFLPVALILIFVSQPTFRLWLKFAAMALPLAFIFIATTPVNFHGIGLDLFPFYRDDAARLAGQIFLVASLVLIAYKHFSLRRQAKQNHP